VEDPVGGGEHAEFVHDGNVELGSVEDALSG
jgi:hypothetical protein